MSGDYTGNSKIPDTLISNYRIYEGILIKYSKVTDKYG